MWEIIDRAHKHFDNKEEMPEYAELGFAMPDVYFDCENDDVYYKLTCGRPVTGRVVYLGGYEARFRAIRDNVDWLEVEFKDYFAKPEPESDQA